MFKTFFGVAVPATAKRPGASAVNPILQRNILFGLRDAVNRRPLYN